MSSILPGDVKNSLQTITTSYYGVSGDNALIHAVHLQWDAVLACVFTFWATNFPENGPANIALNSVVAGDWAQLQPTSGYTAISPAGAATLGASPLIITVPGGTAGCAFCDLGNSGAHRLRVQVACTVAGQLRIRAAGKR